MLDIFFMEQAVLEAKKAFRKQEIPVGAILVNNENNQIIAKAHNLMKKANNPLAHAELLLLQKASKKVDFFSCNLSLYVTLEPCPMCAGAILLSRIKRLVFATNDFKNGAMGSAYNLIHNSNLHFQIEIIQGFKEKECSLLLKKFFNQLRKTDA